MDTLLALVPPRALQDAMAHGQRRDDGTRRATAATAATLRGEVKDDDDDGGNTSPSSSSGGGGGGGDGSDLRDRGASSSSRANKKRKPTYYARKDEKVELLAAIEQLQEKLERLESARPRHREELVHALTLNALLHDDVRRIDDTFAGIRGLVSGFEGQRQRSPIETYIHLHADPLARRQMLLGLKEPKLRAAAAFVLERCRFMDLNRPHRQTETVETADGDFLAMRFDIVVFRDVASVKEVFEEIRFFLSSQEISISERLGIITIRESEDEDHTIAQFRLLSTIENALELESNTVLFANYSPTRSELIDREHGVLALDYVDHDELYAYQPDRRVRKDVTAGGIVVASPQQDSEHGITVSMVRWSHVRQHRPRFAVDEAHDELSREGAGRWCDVMTKVVKERLAWRRKGRRLIGPAANAVQMPTPAPPPSMLLFPPSTIE